MQISSFDLTLAPPAASLEHVDEMRSRAAQPDVQELVQILQHDPVSTAHVLRQANSLTRSGRQSVASLDRAVTMLGFDAICNAIFIESFSEKRRGSETAEFRGAYTYIMRTSIAAADIAGGLALHFELQDPSAVRTAALVHQLGRMALLSSEPAAYARLWSDGAAYTAEAMRIPPGIGREVVRFGIDYMRLGEELARQWRLPSRVLEAVRYHSDPERVETEDRLNVLVLAVSQLASRSLYETERDLDRDQSADRIEAAFQELTRIFPVSRRLIDDLLEEAKPGAYDAAERVKLFNPPAV